MKKILLILALTFLTFSSALSVVGYVNLIVGFNLVLISPNNATYTSNIIPLIYYNTSPVEWCGYSLNGANNITLQGNTTLYAQTGSNKLEIYCNNSFGTYFYKLILFTVTPPSETPSEEKTSEVSIFPITFKEVKQIILSNFYSNDTFSEILINFNKPLINPSIEVSEVKCPSINVSGIFYKCLSINRINVKIEEISNASLKFKVEKNWIERENIDANTISVLKVDNEKIENLKVEKIKEDNNYIYYMAFTNNFSDFIIYGQIKKISVCGDGLCNSDESQASCCYDCGCPVGKFCVENKCTSSLPALIIKLNDKDIWNILFILTCLLMFIYMLWPRKTNKEKN